MILHIEVTAQSSSTVNIEKLPVIGVDEPDHRSSSEVSQGTSSSVTDVTWSMNSETLRLKFFFLGHSASQSQLECYKAIIIH